MLDQAFEALKTYDWGTDRKVLDPIEKAVVGTRDDAEARKDLEDRLAAVLKTDVSRDAKGYVCRKLRVVGTAASVPTLAELLYLTGAFVASTIWPIAAGLYWRRTNAAGATLAMLLGTGAGLYSYFAVGFYVAALTGAAVSMLTVIITTWLRPAFQPASKA